MTVSASDYLNIQITFCTAQHSFTPCAFRCRSNCMVSGRRYTVISCTSVVYKSTPPTEVFQEPMLMPTERFSLVVRVFDLAITFRPSKSKTTASVQVPPVSIPIAIFIIFKTFFRLNFILTIFCCYYLTNEYFFSIYSK